MYVVLHSLFYGVMVMLRERKFQVIMHDLIDRELQARPGEGGAKTGLKGGR